VTIYISYRRNIEGTRHSQYITHLLIPSIISHPSKTPSEMQYIPTRVTYPRIKTETRHKNKQRKKRAITLNLNPTTMLFNILLPQAIINICLQQIPQLRTDNQLLCLLSTNPLSNRIANTPPLALIRTRRRNSRA